MQGRDIGTMPEQESKDRMDITIGVILTATVAMVMLCYVAIPVVAGAINSVKTGMIGNVSITSIIGDVSGILTVVVIMIAIGIIISVVRGFNERAR